MPKTDKRKKRSLPERRPAETAAALISAPAAFGALIELGLPPLLAAILAVLVALIPGGISAVRDLLDDERS